MSDAAAARPLRVLHVNAQRRLRGGEAQTIALARELGRRGHETAFVCQASSPVEASAREAGVPVHPVRMRADADPFAVSAITRLLRRGRWDVLHAHDSHAVGIGALAVAWPGGPGRRPARVYTRRLATSISRGTSLGLNRWKYRLGVDACIAISGAVARQLVADGIPGSRIAIVPSGVEITPGRVGRRRPSAARRRALGLPASGPLIGNVSHLEWEKGVDVLMDAFESISAARPGTTLVIVGDGPDRAALEQRAARPGLRGRVLFLGHRPDVGSILEALDLYVAPGRREALGTSILQAQGRGLGVVATSVGGTPEVVRDGETGLLVPPDAPFTLGEAMGRLLDDPALRHRLGEAARRRVSAEFSTERMVSGTLEVYRRVVKRRGVRRG